jgi:cell division septation protein DedD
MKKILVLILVAGFAFTGCKYFSGNKVDPKVAQLDNALQKEKTMHAKDLEKLKAESQAKIDSLKASCEKQLNRYHIIVGAFKVQANANNYNKQMSSKGYPAHLITYRTFQLISVGSFASLKEAVGQLSKFRNEVVKDAWIYVR